MTEPEITKAEREELLATHARVTRPTRDYLPTDEADWKRLRDSTLLPRLLRALDEAEAERDALKAELARTSEVAAIAAKSLAETEEEIDAAESLAWDALGRPDGTHNDSNVQRLCAAYGEVKAERGRLRKVLLLLDRITDGREESNGTDPEEIQIVVERFVALKTENAALKAKLAALVVFNEKLLGRERREVYPDCDFCRDSGHGHECPGPIQNPRWAEIHDAIAAAKEPQP